MLFTNLIIGSLVWFGLGACSIQNTEFHASADSGDININATPAALSISEGGSAKLNVMLTKQPAANVMVHVDLQGGNVTINRTDLTFTPQNYDQAQSVVVAALQDSNTDNESSEIMLSIPEIPEVIPVAIGVSIADDDIQTVIADAPIPLVMRENQTVNFGVTLKFPPTNDVAVAVSSLDSTIVTAVPGILTFTPMNYNNASLHQVTVHAVNNYNLLSNMTKIRLHEPSLVDTFVSINVENDDQ